MYDLHTVAKGDNDTPLRLHPFKERIWSAADAQRSHFALPNWLMENAVTMMAAFGMIDFTREYRTLPAPADFGLTEDEIAEALDRMDSGEIAELPAGVREYEAAHAEVLDSTVEAPAGIPFYKLEYHEGRLVTPTEIDAALAAAGPDVHDAHPEVEWWPIWMDWLRYARVHGGFRVN